MPLPRLNLVGAGKLGRTLARLWHQSGLVEIGAVATRHRASAVDAVAFIGAGTPTTYNETTSSSQSIDDWPEADYWLLAAPDDALPDLAQRLAAERRDWHNRLLFHCSGVSSAEILEPLARGGALTASAHPIHSFADPQQSLTDFAGAFCLIEGHGEAADGLQQLFAGIGAEPLVTPHCNKPLYHAATATASNLLVALLHSAESMLVTATGLPHEQARQLLAPLSRQTLDNVFRLGAPASLTGPIARGDADTVARHLAALSAADPHWYRAYRTLSQIAVHLAVHKGDASPAALQQIRNQLDEST